jgi:3-oxochol-4-en-24-oyl-CoA dehydrogenase
MLADSAEVTAELANSAADYCRRALPLRRLRVLREAGDGFDRVVWRQMAELGWTAMSLPERLGGLGLGAAGVASLCRQLGRVVAPEPIIETAVVAATLLAGSAGTDARVSALIAGEAVFACPLTAATWRNFTCIEAVPEGASYVLTGALDNLPLAPDADYVLLPARCANQPSVFCVPVTTPGLHLRPRTLADGSRDGSVRLVAVCCAAGDRLVGNQQAIDTAVALGGIGGSAYLLGLCEALLDITLDYVRTRRQFGHAIGSFQALQHRLVDMYLQVRLSAAALNDAVAAGNDESIVAATRARHRAVETAHLVIREAIQMHGAIGYTEQCDVALFVQRALVMAARYGVTAEELSATGAANAVGDGNEDVTMIDENAAPPDDDWNALEDITFRAIVRRWIATNYPAHLRHFPGQVRWAEISDWHQRLLARGWAAPAWPVQHGGMGLGPSKMLIFIEELERHGVARAPDQGIVMIGPILIEYGTPDQRARYLKHALTGQHIWCQGYSEPNAGSDLASLATTAVIDGDEFIVNGQKTWTTHALDATHMYCLVRTDTQVKPQRGISFLLIDLDQPGVTIRPIRNLGGHVDFCEVFLDNVRVPRANLVGEINTGWTIAKALLGHERLFVGSPKLCQHALNQLRELAHATGKIHDPVFMDALRRIALEVRDLESLYTEFAAILKQGGALGADVALLKIGTTEAYVRLSELIVKTAGEFGGGYGKQNFNGVEIDVLSHYYSARPAPIYAGSNEIQRNIIAKHVLQLPS